jgi:putative flippase GtrA
MSGTPTRDRPSDPQAALEIPPAESAEAGPRRPGGGTWIQRAVKFGITGFTGYLVHMGALAAAVELLGAPPLLGAVAGFSLAMPWNYILNRAWTFRARHVAVVDSFWKYAGAAVAGFYVQIAVMLILSRVHYMASATLGIVAGAACTFLASQSWVFRSRRP